MKTRDELRGFGGIITVNGTDRCLGDLAHVFDRGTFCPEYGQVEVTRNEANAHNRALGAVKRLTAPLDGTAVLYLTHRDDGWHVTDFAETFDVRPTRVVAGAHNIAGRRHDVRFELDGLSWWGRNMGDNNILRCRRVSRRVAR